MLTWMATGRGASEPNERAKCRSNDDGLETLKASGEERISQCRALWQWGERMKRRGEEERQGSAR